MVRSVSILLAALALTGCALTDPYYRDGVWRPSDVNEANLRVMVASPADLVRGVSSPAADGQQAAAALDRQRNDKVRPLPDSAIAKVVPVASGSGSQQGGQ
jgi:type IV pilus biogenesis protein CpaD/CtpE